MITASEVLETKRMVEQDNLDVRTITMGISLLDCVSSDLKETCDKIYNKITTLAKDLVKTGESISREIGIPIVHKRVSVTPVSLVGAACCKTVEDYVAIAKTLDDAAKKIGVNFLGGFSAIVSKGMTPSEELLIRSIPKALAVTDVVCSSVNVGSTKTGINMDAVALMGKTVKAVAEATAERDGLGAAKLVVFCNIPQDVPFMAGAYLGVGEPDVVIDVGVSGPGVVNKALQRAIEETGRRLTLSEIAEVIKHTAYKVTRVGELIGRNVAREMNLPFGVADLSLAPTPAVGDSVGEIFQTLGLSSIGAPGSTAILAMLNDAVKKGGVFASGNVGGLSGAFIPVSEDSAIEAAARSGALTMEKLEAMTCVCSVGLDMIAVPGSTTAETISAIIADEAAVGMVNSKTTAVRIIPVEGADVGDTVEMGGLLGSAPLMPVHEASSADFIARGGRIPAPLQSLKN